MAERANVPDWEKPGHDFRGKFGRAARMLGWPPSRLELFDVDADASPEERHQKLQADMETVKQELAALKAQIDRKASEAARRFKEAQSQVKDATIGYYSDDSVACVLMVCCANLVGLCAAVICLVGLYWCIGANLLKSLYVPRLAFRTSLADGDQYQPPPELESRFLSWLTVVLRVNGEDFLNCCGLDAFMLCRLPLLGLRFCASALVVCGPLLGLYGWEDPSGKQFRSASRVSLCNVPPGSRLLWLPVVAAYHVILSMCVLLWQEEKVFTQALRQYMLGLCSRYHPLRETFRTVRVEDLPRPLRSEAALQAEFEALFGPDCVEALQVTCSGHDTPPPPPLPEAEGVAGPLHEQDIGADAIEPLGGSLRPQLRWAPGRLTRQLCRAVPRIARGLVAPFLKMTRLLVTAALDTASSHRRRPALHEAAEGFVTFRKHTTHAMALQLALPEYLLVSTAPYPSDVVEANVGRSLRLIEWRTSVVDVLLLGGMLLWSLPVTIIQIMASWRNLQPYIPIQIDETSRLHGMLAQYAPVYAWIALLSLLQYAFWWVAEYYEGVKKYSEIQLHTMKRYWFYNLCTMYITVLSGSVLDSVGQTWAQPRKLVLFLGQSLPQVSIFFLCVVLSKAMLTLPLSALRPAAVLDWMWQRLAHGGEPPAIAAAPWARSSEAVFGAADYGSKLPDLLLVFTICLVYAPIAPVVLVAGALFFSVAVLTFRFGALYMWQPQFESQGGFFRFFLAQTVSLLPVAVLTLSATLILLRGFVQSALLTPLLGFTLVFRRWMLARLPVQTRIPLQLAKELDLIESELVWKYGAPQRARDPGTQ